MNVPSLSLEAKFVLAVAAGLGLLLLWLTSDRAPTQKEMTFAFRKYVVAEDQGGSEGLAGLRRQLHGIELAKDDCARLAPRQYRCRATVFLEGLPLPGHPTAEMALYRHDMRGWRFEPGEGE